MDITTATLTAVTTTDTGATEFTFATPRPLRHRAGQAALVLVPGGGAKPFTLSSGTQADTLSIATSLVSGSRFKTALGALVPGDRIRLLGAFGGLPAVHAERVLVAQGIGITPFLAIARTEGTVAGTLLQVGAPHFFDEVAAAMTDAEHVAHRAELQAAVARTIAARPDADWSISGRSDFVAAVAAQLRAAGVATRRIHRAAFVGMRSATPVVAPVAALA